MRGGRSDITTESKGTPSDAEQQKRLEYQEELRVQMEKKKQEKEIEKAKLKAEDEKFERELE